MISTQEDNQNTSLSNQRQEMEQDLKHSVIENHDINKGTALFGNQSMDFNTSFKKLTIAEQHQLEKD